MSKKAYGFTIVELLVVIVVIAILAAISIVAYNGIQDRAVSAAMQSDLRNAMTQLSLAHTDSGVYPGVKDGLSKSAGIDYQYDSDGATFCLTATSNRVTAGAWHVSNEGSVSEGACPGHSATSDAIGFASRAGYTDITFSYGPGAVTISASVESISTGSWMIVILAYTDVVNPTPPAGWTTLVSRKDTGTLRTSIFAKIKESGDSATQLFSGPGSGTTNAVLLWGNGSAPVSAWTLGSFGDRSVNATPSTVVTPTLTTTAARSLVLSIATERTNANETTYSSLAGATPWIWIPHPHDSPKNQTIAVVYNEQANAGVSQPVTVTYPNTQANNGTAVQIAIPPAS